MQQFPLPPPAKLSTLTPPHSFAVPSVVSWRRLTIFFPPSSPPFFDVELMGRKGREINRGFSTSPSNGRTSVSWRRAATQRDRETEVGEEDEGGGGGEDEGESLLHGSRASERASGPTQGSAPPADKRSILSISLSALDNKQKFNRPSSCLAFETCRFTHALTHRSEWPHHRIALKSGIIATVIKISSFLCVCLFLVVVVGGCFSFENLDYTFERLFRNILTCS